MFPLYYHLIFSFVLYICGYEQTWECGNDDFSKLLSESSIEANCPELKWEVNGCCINHDSCYDKQLGRKNCDDTFCDCLSRVTISSKRCHEDDAESFCILVREFGEAAYNASAPHLHVESTTAKVSSIPTTTTSTRKSFTKHKSSGNFNIRNNNTQLQNGTLTTHLPPRRLSKRHL
ncbi:Phospholipase A2 domain-containing protein [Strongyloides ratti]|uniref:Phospholipase A2 domain-containing protein n=1 Tax=Strongyloides ratti TaxID=34506 RepID=A0A090L5I6_STRRB|nr:Phospholipase A2 domain-containing protein [Strongyloides ratti]CEF64992.1 Phospholipase A2 domain-containing protein [Strongyloides ratti]